MQIVFLLALSCVLSAAAVFCTGRLRKSSRTLQQNILLFVIGVLICLAGSVAVEAVLKAGRPTFYYHTHALGKATVKLFGIGCLSAVLFYALLLVLIESRAQKPTVFRCLVRAFLFAFCGALILEVGYFNQRHFELIGSGAEEKTYYSDDFYGWGFYFNRASWSFACYDKDDYNFGIGLTVGNQKIRNMWFNFDDAQPRTRVQIAYNDRAHSGTENIPEHEFIDGISRSYSVPLHTVGNTKDLSVEFPDALCSKWAGYYGFSLPEMVINKVVPLELDPVRFGLAFVLIFVIAAFFPGSPLWKLPVNFRSPAQMCGIGCLLLFFTAACVWTMLSSYSGSDLSWAEQKNVISLIPDQYNKLAESFRHHRFALHDTVDSHLLEMSDPYDYSARVRQHFSYPFDTVYYDGNYYVYFGPVPVLTVILPYRLLTGDYPETDYVSLGFALLFLLGILHLYSRLVRRFFPRLPYALYWLGLAALLTALNVSWCLRRGLVYELAILSGVCFAVWAVYLLFAAFSSRKLSPLWAAGSGLCAGLAVGCRPTAVLIAPILFVTAYFLMKENGSMKTKGNAARVILFLLPYIACGLALMKYNYERFDNPFEFGITYQLTIENRATGMPLTGVYGRAMSVLSSLFQAPTVDTKFPFVHLQHSEFDYNGKIQNNYEVLGLFSFPLMWLIFILPKAFRRLKQHGAALPAFIICCLISAAAICFVASGFCTAQRYLTDYAWLAGIAAVMLLFCLYEKCFESGWTLPAEGFTMFCFLIGLAFFAALALTGEGEWFKIINPLGYDKLRYAYSPWL